MGQAEVWKILKKNYPKFVTFEQIQMEIKTTKSSIFRCLKILSKRDDIQIKTIWLPGKARRQKTYYRMRKE